VRISGARHFTLADLEKGAAQTCHVTVRSSPTVPDRTRRPAPVWRSRLRQHGFSSVRALVGRFEAWEQAGYPVEQRSSQAKERPAAGWTKPQLRNPGSDAVAGMRLTTRARSCHDCESALVSKTLASTVLTLRR
jgi:hypothetical protein